MSARCQTLVIEIKGNSLDDGPGILLGGLFQGLSAVVRLVSQSGESRSRGAELSWDPSLCVACGTCS